jgi:hypothetical protein
MQLHRSDMQKRLGWIISKLEVINVIDDIQGCRQINQIRWGRKSELN